METEHFLAFAYGSNMALARIRARCPSARAVGVAELRGYELYWHKASKDGSGKCDVVASAKADASVFGVLYEIDSEDKAALDRAEGKGFGYEEIDIDLVCGQEPVRATAYRATITDPKLQPYTWYHALVLAGAREHKLPEDYIARLEAVLAKKDTDLARHNENMRLIGEVHA